MKVSVIIPCKEIGDWLQREIIPAILNQTYKNFEIIILPDEPTSEKILGVRVIPTWPKLGPADKKDIGVENAKGDIIAFIDDDAYPDKNWLKNATSYFKNGEVAAVCGPGLTPPGDPLLAKVSGWMWSSPLGSGGAGQYRNWPKPKREIDDYPTFNLIVRKSDFKKAGGFDSQFWPGEDTKFCLDLVYRLKKKIIYSPEVVVYHHRRRIFKDHLKQLGRYGKHRGYFAKILPETSRRLGYFIPLLFALGFLAGPLAILSLQIAHCAFLAHIAILSYCYIVGVYFFLLVLNSLWVLRKSRSFMISLLLVPTIFISHIFYGLMFLKGLLKKDFKSKFSRELL